MEPKDPLYDLLVKQTSEARKKAPVQAGFNDYFPDAILAVALMSYMANQKHNPTEALGWSWNRSDDHADCVARHSLRPDTDDEFGLNHRIARAWRAMADLQKYLVEKYGLELPPAAYIVPEDLTEESLEKSYIEMDKKMQDQGMRADWIRWTPISPPHQMVSRVEGAYSQSVPDFPRVSSEELPSRWSKD